LKHFFICLGFQESGDSMYLFANILNRLPRAPWQRVLIAASSVLLVCGCASKPKQDNHLPKVGGNFSAPVVISGSPQRDQRAIAAANDQLSEADWRVLEKIGPRPIWEQIEGKRKRSEANGSAKQDDDGDANATPGVPAAQSPSVSLPMPIDERELPIRNMDAPEGKSRFIWVLRSFGGSDVATSRDASTSRRSVKLSVPDLAPLVAAVTQQMEGTGTVVALPRENTLVVTCDTATKPQVLQLLASLDVPASQVEISVKIFEVSQNFDFQQGANLVLNRIAGGDTQSLISTFSAKRFAEAVGSATPANGSALQLMKLFQNAGVSVDFTFQLLEESGLIQVVSSPRMTVAVGQTGYMLAGQELPIQSANFVNNILQTTTQYKPVGVQLYITPQAASGSRVKLHTISIVSSVSGFAPLPNLDGGSSIDLINPIIDSREAETAVTINDGDTLVISGLRMVRSTTQEEKIPGLGDIPGIEWMFKNHRTQQRITDLYFFVTPTLLPVEEAAAFAP